MNDTASIGMVHLLAQSDAVGKTLLFILLGMSALSWCLIVVRGVTLLLRKRHSDKFLAFFWNARSLDEVQAEISTHGVRDPFSHLSAHAILAQAHRAL